jgi:radical SAM superfamily enzyme YgiQ (UPF0313 family)
MNVLLLNPPSRDKTIMVKEGRCMQRKAAWGYIMAPVTMVTIATMLRDQGHSVTVLDCPAEMVDLDGMLARAASFSPDLALVNTSTPTIDDDLHAALLLKQYCAKPVVTALYGIHPTCMYKELLATGNGVDCCIIGEPEFTIRDLVQALSCGAGIGHVEGVASVDAAGHVAVSRERVPSANLDELPIPDWSLVDTGNYRLPLNNEKFLLVNTNRGCPYRCTFCNAYAYYGRVPRRRSVPHIMQELQNDVNRFGVNNFMFWAEEFILDRDFVMELCDAICSSGLNVKWVCNSRVDAVDAEVLAAIKKAGCWNIAFGIESGNQHILDSINKGITLEGIRHAVSMAKAAGLQVTGHVIIGFPEDTVETIRTTEKFVNSLDLDFVQYYCAMPYPGTRLYEDAVRHGWLNTSDWQKWEHNYSVLDYGELKASEIMKIRRSMLQRYYFNPARVIRTLRNHVKKPSDLLAFVSRIRGFLRWM